MVTATRPGQPASAVEKELNLPRQTLVVWIVIVTLILLGGVIAKTAITPPSRIKVTMTIQTTRVWRGKLSSFSTADAGWPGLVAVTIYALWIDPTRLIL